MLKYLSLFIIVFYVNFSGFAQNLKDTIDEKEVIQILSYLASDSLKGRGNYTPDLRKAAHFIASKFNEAGLDFFPGYSSYFLPFTSKSLSINQFEKDSSAEYDPKNILYNVIGILPGNSLADEAIIFCAHYDHIGVNKKNKKDSIFNGANDNASGTTGMLSLAKYFAAKQNNERTIVFCAFAGEEIGLIGSDVFVKKMIAKNIKAVINIEMIGRCTISNSFFITGSSYSNFEKIIRKNLKNYKIKILQEPDESMQLFNRSDNYPFALKGIPAHTIMCSDDSDKCYHKTCDEVNRIDFKNMVKVIEAIGIGSESIISGKDTPSRINTNKIR